MDDTPQGPHDLTDASSRAPGDTGGEPGAPEAGGDAAPETAPASRAHQAQYAPVTASWSQLVKMFLKLGFVAFGGPVAHIAMMDEEIVEKRRWITRQHFLDLMAATNLLPGPNSSQMTMHIGYVQKGDLGAVAAGSAFVFPAFLITLALSWAYVAYRELPLTDAFFYGIQPVVVAIIAAAMWRLTPKAITDRWTMGIFLVALGIALLGGNEVLVMALGGLAGFFIYYEPLQAWLKQRLPVVAALPVVLLELGRHLLATTARVGQEGGEFLVQLFLLFLKFGLILYGSGYLLIIFIQTDLVDRFGLLTTQQLVEAVTIGEMTPGPVLTTSTVIGYILAGGPGAVIATFAIFFPSFFLAMLLGRWMPVIKASATAAAVLKGLTAAVVAVMLAVTLLIAREVVVDPVTVALALGSLGLLVKFKISAIVLILVGGVVGYAMGLVL